MAKRRILTPRHKAALLEQRQEARQVHAGPFVLPDDYVALKKAAKVFPANSVPYNIETTRQLCATSLLGNIDIDKPVQTSLVPGKYEMFIVMHAMHENSLYLGCRYKNDNVLYNQFPLLFFPVATITQVSPYVKEIEDILAQYMDIPE